MQGAVSPSLRNHVLDALLERGKQIAWGKGCGGLPTGASWLAANACTAGRPDAASGRGSCKCMLQYSLRLLGGCSGRLRIGA